MGNAAVRIRSTKPEFWKSKTIADALGWSDRLVLKGLEAYVDDNGVGKDDIELIATEVFPRDTFRSPRETVGRLSEAISRIHQAGLIARYEVDGEKFLYVDKWKDLQRIDKPSKGRYPRPDGSFEYIQPVNRESYRSPREGFGSPPENLAPGTGEQGNRGTGDFSSPTTNVSTECAPTKTTGAEKALARFSAIPSQHSQLARQIVGMYSDSLDTPIDAKTGREIAQAVDTCIQAGQSPEAIAAGIELWAKSDSFSPSQIGKYVTKAAAARRPSGIGKPTQKAATTDQLAAEILAEMDNS